MIDLKFTPVATEKYQLYTNGINKTLTTFFDSLRDETIKPNDLLKIKTISRGKNLEKIYIYQKKVSAIEKSVFVILLKTGTNLIVADIMPQSDYEKEFNK